MDIKRKTAQLEGMHGWNIKEADISLAIDETMGSYSVKISSVHQRGEFDYITEEEMDFLKKIFRIK